MTNTSTLQGNFMDQWIRTLRFRKRYSEVLALAPSEMMSTRLMPPDRKAEIDTWFGDEMDYGITCAMNLHHLKDWADHDPSVPFGKDAVHDLIATERAMGMIADIANGVKHSKLAQTRRSDVIEPFNVGRATRMVWRTEADGSRRVHACHEVASEDGSIHELSEVLDEAIRIWTRLLRSHGFLR